MRMTEIVFSLTTRFKRITILASMRAKTIAGKLYQAKGRVESLEELLATTLDADLKGKGAGKALTERLHISGQFLCDVRKGRRKFSAALLREMAEM